MYNVNIDYEIVLLEHMDTSFKVICFVLNYKVYVIILLTRQMKNN